MIRIEFLPTTEDDLNVKATRMQAKTYRLLQRLLAGGQRVPVSTFMVELGLSDPRPFRSRIQHLEEKGFLRVREVPPSSTSA